MEDARLVRFTDDDGTITYYAPFTAYDGARIATAPAVHQDFRHFEVSPLAGRAAQNKGLSLFPRRVAGRYAALSRWDRENLSLAYSEDGQVLGGVHDPARPQDGWELIQVGNGGSADRNIRGLARAHPRRRPDAAVRARRHAARPERTVLVVATLRGPLLTRAPTSATGMYPTSSTPAARCCTRRAHSSVRHQRRRHRVRAS